MDTTTSIAVGGAVTALALTGMWLWDKRNGKQPTLGVKSVAYFQEENKLRVTLENNGKKPTKVGRTAIRQKVDQIQDGVHDLNMPMAAGSAGSGREQYMLISERTDEVTLQPNEVRVIDYPLTSDGIVFANLDIELQGVRVFLDPPKPLESPQVVEKKVEEIKKVNDYSKGVQAYPRVDEKKALDEKYSSATQSWDVEDLVGGKGMAQMTENLQRIREEKERKAAEERKVAEEPKIDEPREGPKSMDDLFKDLPPKRAAISLGSQILASKEDVKPEPEPLVVKVEESITPPEPVEEPKLEESETTAVYTVQRDSLDEERPMIAKFEIILAKEVPMTIGGRCFKVRSLYGTISERISFGSTFAEITYEKLNGAFPSGHDGWIKKKGTLTIHPHQIEAYISHPDDEYGFDFFPKFNEVDDEKPKD